MAGARFSVRLDDGELQKMFAALVHAGADIEPVFADIGEHLLESTRARFDEQVDPEGNAWEPLKPATSARKKKNSGRILIDSGMLMGEMSYEADAGGLMFGSNKIYAATHQFGRPEAGVPARPFLGLSKTDIIAIERLLHEHLSDAIR